MDIEPPEVPLLFSKEELKVVQKEEQKPEHKGFFSKLFAASKKKDAKISENKIDNAEIDFPKFSEETTDVNKGLLEMPPLPDLPPVPESNGILQTSATNPDTTEKIAKKEKKSFWNSKKKEIEKLDVPDSKNPIMPSLDMNQIDDDLKDLESQLPLLPDVSNLYDQDNSPKIFIAGEKDNNYNTKDTTSTNVKGKGKKSSKIEKIDESHSFDWNEPINKQENVVSDNNRNNPDANKLSLAADGHIDDTKNLLNSKNISEFDGKEVAINMDIPDISEMPEITTKPMMPKIPRIHPVEKKSFLEMDKQHKTLKKKMEKSIKNRLKATDIKALLSQYDTKIEQKIEQKELELTYKRDSLEAFDKLLKKKEKELKDLNKYLEQTDSLLKKKESTITEIISAEVDKRVKNISKNDKKILRTELLNTVSLNKQLKKQLDIIEKDRMDFDIKKEKLLDEERRILTNSQTMYENKLAELEKEKHEFESRKREGIILLHRAGAISKELQELKSLKQALSQDRRIIDELIIEDKSIREAVRIAEDNLKKEKGDLDKTVFSRYIQWKLGEAKFEDIQGGALIKSDPIDTTHQVYDVMDKCKEMLKFKDIKEAKILYNQAKELYDNTSFNNTEKILVYNKLRALYSDIQLTSLDADIIV